MDDAYNTMFKLNQSLVTDFTIKSLFSTTHTHILRVKSKGENTEKFGTMNRTLI